MPKLFLLDHRPSARIVFVRPARPQVARVLVPLTLIAAVGVVAFFEYRSPETPVPKPSVASSGEAAPILAAQVNSDTRSYPTRVGDGEDRAAPRPSDEVSGAQRTRADSFYRDARIARLCAAWFEEQERLSAARQKRQGRAPTAAENDAELAAQARGIETGASTTCPSLGMPDLAQADLQMKEAARLGSPEARYEVLADKLLQLRAEKLAAPASPFAAPALPSQEILDLRSELSALANAGNVPAQFLMASTLREGTLGQSDQQLATAWEMVAIHAPGPVFDIHSVVQYGPYASASASEKVALAAAAAAIFQSIQR